MSVLERTVVGSLTKLTVAAAEKERVLELKNVSKTFPSSKGPYTALEGVSLGVDRGDLVALIGHSGCGKSTLLNLVAGLEHPSSGAVLVGDSPVTQPGPDRAMVFQHYSLLPWLTVRENVYQAVDSALAHLSHSEKAAHADHFLEMVGLGAASHKHPHELSGGMRQRVAIARAFAVHPRVLLLDEPFGALDALTKGALQEHLLNMWSMERKAETVLLVTHDIDEAIYLADRIVVMTNGPAAHIGEIINVTLPRPRDKRAMVHDEAYAALKDRLLYLLTQAYAGSETAA